MITRELGNVAQADKPTERVEARGVEQVEERERGVKPGEAGARKWKSRKNLQLSLRGSVEVQAQHWPDRLHKPRTGLVWTDRLGREVIGQIFREGIYLGVSIGAHL